MFIKTAQLATSVFVDNQSDLKNLHWTDIVRSGKHFESPFLDNFEWNPEEFLYYRCRAITADVPNQNGDFFPDVEIDKAYKTFIGKGVYYGHQSDHPDKAFGIILDAIYHKYPDDKYVQILGAIDKEDIERKRPGLLNRIKSGSLNTTSMSVGVKRCECSICHNIANTPQELCPHMDKNSPFYVKGRMYNGIRAYEINYGLTFFEDSLVENPADPTAYVFQIYASLNQSYGSSKLASHFQKYSSAKQEFEKSGGTQETLEKVVDEAIDKKIKNKIIQIVDEKIRTKIDPILQNIEKSTVETVDTVVDKAIVEKQRNIGLDVLEPKDEKTAPVKPEENTKQPESTKDKKQSIPEKDNLGGVKMPELKKSFKIQADSEVVVEKNDALSLIDELFEQTDENKTKLKEKADIIDMGNGIVFNRIDGRKYLVFKDGKSLNITVEVDVDFFEKDLEEQKKDIMDKFNLIVESKEKNTFKEVASSMNITYTKGSDFDNSFFVISEGDQITKVAASEIIPKDVQERILNNDNTVVSTDEIINQLNILSNENYSNLVNEVIPELKKAYSNNEPEKQEKTEPKKEDIQEQIKTASLKKQAEWSMAEDEIPAQKLVKVKEGPVMSVNKEEIVVSDKPSTQPSKVKQYYSKLPGKAVDEPINALNVQSSKEITDLEIKSKLDILKRALEEEKSKNIELSKALSIEKEKTEKRDKTEQINMLLEVLSEIADIEESNKAKIVEILNKFAPIQLGMLKQLVELLGEKNKEKEIDNIAIKSLDKSPEKKIEKPIKPFKEEDDSMKKQASLPQFYINNNENDFDVIDIAIKSLMK